MAISLTNTHARPIAVDLSGGEVLPSILYEACKTLEKNGSALRYYAAEPFSSNCVVCPQTIEMNDGPFAFRKKKDSSLVHALKDLALGDVSALVTCANTGATVSAAAIYLGRFANHPALATKVPSKKAEVLVLDVGAFVKASTENLVEYAALGYATASSHYGVLCPRIGLLNIGKEPAKGPTELHRANEILLRGKKDSFHYVGFVEPIDVFSGEVDVLVTNGFVGNIFLKTAEGVSTIMEHSFSKRLGGALLVGVNNLLVKCHGNSTPEAFVEAIVQAERLVVSNPIPHQKNAFSKIARDLKEL